MNHQTLVPEPFGQTLDRLQTYRSTHQPIGSSIPSAHYNRKGTRNEPDRQNLRQRALCALHPIVQAGRWDIDEDVIRGRRFDDTHKFLPDGLSLADAFRTLSGDEKRFVSQIQGRTYAKVFGLVERFINAKILEMTRDHWLGDQLALEALVRFSDEELKHQALFRRIDTMVGDVLPDGYRFDVDPDAVARAVLGKVPGRCWH